MDNLEQNKAGIISVIKEYAAPSLIGLVGLFIWRDITEMRSDVKLLLVQQSIDKVKIEAVQSDVAMLKAAVFPTRNASQDYKFNLASTQPAKKEEEQEIK